MKASLPAHEPNGDSPNPLPHAGKLATDRGMPDTKYLNKHASASHHILSIDNASLDMTSSGLELVETPPPRDDRGIC